MLDTNVRVRPWSERSRVSSEARVTVRTSPSWFTPMPDGRVRVMVPLGPATVTWSPATDTVTPLGTVMGFLPMRDISALPFRTRGYHT